MHTRRGIFGLGAGLCLEAYINSVAVAQTAPSDILGIDTYTYPGDAAMDVLWSAHKFRITGLYLCHSPNKPDRTWPPKRAYLASKGWGFFPVFLGSQDLNPAKGLGAVHGNLAATMMAGAGFPKSSVVYLDVETPKPPGGLFETYIKDWNTAVSKAGFTPGIYCSYLMVTQDDRWVTKLTQAVWTVELPFAKARVAPDVPIEQRAVIPFAYDPVKNPHGVIREGCLATQFLWYRHAPDLQLPKGVSNVFDFNSARVADPSNAQQIAEYLRVPRLGV